MYHYCFFKTWVKLMSWYGENLLFFQSFDKQLGPSGNELMKPTRQDFSQHLNQFGSVVPHFRRMDEQSVREYLRLTLVFMWDSALREGFTCYCSGRFCQYWRVVYIGMGNGCQAIILGGLDTFLIFPNLVRLEFFFSFFFSCAGTFEVFC